MCSYERFDQHDAFAMHEGGFAYDPKRPCVHVSQLPRLCDVPLLVAPGHGAAVAGCTEYIYECIRDHRVHLHLLISLE